MILPCNYINGLLQVKPPSQVGELLLDMYFSCGYFDGESQAYPCTCGAGGVLFLNEGFIFKFKLRLGIHANYLAELQALKSLPNLANDKIIDKRYVFGDLKLVIKL